MGDEERRSEEDPGQGQGPSAESGGSDLGRGHEGDGAQEVKLPEAAQETLPAETALPEIPIIAENRSFHVKLSIYDGPLDLLLELIKKNEMDIYNIQVSVVTQQYLDYLATLKKLDLEIAGEFIVMAATLLYIKSKMLLPQEEGEEDEEGGDPRAELVRKLMEYQAFKEAAKELGLLENDRSKVFTRQISDYYLTQLDPEDVEIDTFSANLFDLLSAFQKVLAKHGSEQFHEVFEQIVSIEEKMEEIRGKLIRQKRVVFSELFSGRFNRNILIVTFLSILEIVRTKFARVRQDKEYDEIYVEKIEHPLANPTE